MTTAASLAENNGFDEFICDGCGNPVGACCDQCDFWAALEEEEFCPDCCHIQHSGAEVNYLLKCVECSEN